MILLEKYDITNGKNELLNAWTTLFNNIDELLDFLQKHKEYLLGGNLDQYELVIRNVKLKAKENKYE